MKVKIAFIFVCLLPCLISFDNKDCKTTFTIKDCKDNPVEGATITVERCSDKKKFNTTTNSKGEGSFPLCKEEICKTKISSVGYESRDVSSVGNNCKGNNCIIKICSD
ncbi:MAG: carboxypeptidase regulatory-like domain-containing protein [Filimonas sp.]|nr:carboxypeptidase regulatory-like domain-containing protein [Filimonas sp.]